MPELGAVRAALRSVTTTTTTSTSTTRIMGNESSNKDDDDHDDDVGESQPPPTHRNSLPTPDVATTTKSSSTSSFTTTTTHCPYATAWWSSRHQPPKPPHRSSLETTTTTTTTTTPASSSFVVVDDNNNDNHNKIENNKNDDDDMWELAKTHCPAFTESCPFRNAKTADEVRQTLLQLPSSHWKASYFYRAMQSFHQIQAQWTSMVHTTGTTTTQPPSPPPHVVDVVESSSASSHHDKMMILPVNHHTTYIAEMKSKDDHQEQDIMTKDDSIRSSTTSSSNSSSIIMSHPKHHHHDSSWSSLLEDDSERYRVVGGCPIKQFSQRLFTDQQQQQYDISLFFEKALDDCSWSVLMARMALELEQHEKLSSESSETTTTSTTTTTIDKMTHNSSSQHHNQEEQDNLPNKTMSISIPTLTHVVVTGTTTTNTTGSTSSSSSSTSCQEEEEEKNDNHHSQQHSRRRRHSSGLALALQAGTAASHEAAENVHFVRNFIRGQIDRHLYAQLVWQLYQVYSTLELELDRHGSTIFPKLHTLHQSLHRTDSLQDDVDFWWGSQQRPHDSGSTLDSATTTATQDYVNRIRHISQTDPMLLLAHAYTRYLGDLSGGKILARVARKALHLSSSSSTKSSSPIDGLAFYHFEHVPNPKAFKDDYRKALDQLLLSDDDKDEEEEDRIMMERLVLEANVAFLLNMRLFEELDVMANVPGAQVRSYEEALVQAAQASQTIPTTQRGGGARRRDHHENRTGSSTVVPSRGESSGNETTTTKNPVVCPFAHLGRVQPHQSSSEVTKSSKPKHSLQIYPHHKSFITHHNKNNNHKKRCPWPFVFFHDPQQGMKDWQTWCLIGWILMMISMWLLGFNPTTYVLSSR